MRPFTDWDTADLRVLADKLWSAEGPTLYFYDVSHELFSRDGWRLVSKVGTTHNYVRAA